MTEEETKTFKACMLQFGTALIKIRDATHPNRTAHTGTLAGVNEAHRIAQEYIDKLEAALQKAGAL